MDSILSTIKKMLGITEDYTHFDVDIIVHINTVFLTLTQLGIGPDTGFSISDKYDSWDDFLSQDPRGSAGLLEPVKTYIYLKVKMLFDPPTNSITVESFKNTANEIEWRLMHMDNPTKEVDTNV